MKNNEIRLKLSSPWITFVNKLKALFGEDPEIVFNFCIEEDDFAEQKIPVVSLKTENSKKAKALDVLLPLSMYKNNDRILDIKIDCPHKINYNFKNTKELFEIAFNKNPVFAYVACSDTKGYEWETAIYVVFKNCVVQFFNDNLNDCHGVVTTLYQDIAAELFQEADLGNITEVYYNTDIGLKPSGKTFYEWL